MKTNICHLILITFVLFLYAGCNRNSNVKTQTMIIDIEHSVGNEKEVRLSSVAADIKYIPLETNDNSLLGNSINVYMNDGRIYVFENSQMLFKVFDSNGKYLGNIGQKGKGGGEYSSVNNNSLSFNPENGNIMILSPDKLLEFDRNSRKCIREIKYKGTMMLNKIMILGDYYVAFVYNSEHNPEISILDKEGKEIDAGRIDSTFYKKLRYKKEDKMEIKIGNFNIMPQYIPYNFENRLRLMMSENDTIYSLDKKLKVSDSFIFKWGKYKFNGCYDSLERGPGIFYVPGMTYESKKYLFLALNYGNNKNRIAKGSLYYGIFDKVNGKLQIIDYTEENAGKFLNDIDNGMPFWPRYINSDNEMVAIMDAYKFIDLSNKYNSPEMKRAAAGLTELSNPVVIISKLKD